MQDVREQDEYDVSHLPNAIRVKPDEPVDQVMTKIKQCLESKLRWLAPLVEVSESDQNRTYLDQIVFCSKIQHFDDMIF